MFWLRLVAHDSDAADEQESHRCSSAAAVEGRLSIPTSLFASCLRDYDAILLWRGRGWKSSLLDLCHARDWWERRGEIEKEKEH